MRPWSLCFAFLAAVSQALAQPSSPAGRPVLWILDPPPSDAPHQALAASIQGILNQDGPNVWIRARSLHAFVLERVQDRFSPSVTTDPWELVRSNRARFAGFLACHVTNHTLNLATSLAGPRRALVVDTSLRQTALDLGLPEIADLRAIPAATTFERYGTECARGILVHQPISKPFHLRDLAIARKAWVDFEPATGGLAERVRQLGPDTEVLGWGSEEESFVRDSTRGGGWVIPADWALNLSAHRWLHDPAPQPNPPPAPAPTQPGERIVTFVISDGDNVQWLLGGFATQPGFWSSPRRGTFPVTWELAPRLAELAPAADAWLHRTATPVDAFIGGPSGGGYYFPHHAPDPARMARRSADALAFAGLRITSILNSGGSPDEADVLLADPRIDAVLYKDYAPYNRRQGAVSWHHGKPAVAYRHLLWEQKDRNGNLRPDWLPEGVASAIAASPGDPTSSTEAFSVVQVHAWSFRSQGGPMEAIHETIRRLPPRTRVVTAPDLIALLQPLRPR